MCAVGNISFYVLFALRVYSRGRDHDDDGRRKGGDDAEHYGGRNGFKKRKRGDNISYNSNSNRGYDRHRGG